MFAAQPLTRETLVTIHRCCWTAILLLSACGDRIGGVLQQFPDIDPWAAVKVVAQQVHDPAQVDLEGVAHGVRVPGRWGNRRPLIAVYFHLLPHFPHPVDHELRVVVGGVSPPPSS